eukprot:TRINITY_DN15213_c0_g1_i1.p1 TRINITY_DN15213_c0_g1~~TRINITY_DN15213_c0_g1_i1.p1  ORF type:complete len:748 (-),score=144.63 TRINITY_DN15213_c0_g1_i1:135-2378(-)
MALVVRFLLVLTLLCVLTLGQTTPSSSSSNGDLISSSSSPSTFITPSASNSPSSNTLTTLTATSTTNNVAPSKSSINLPTSSPSRTRSAISGSSLASSSGSSSFVPSPTNSISSSVNPSSPASNSVSNSFSSTSTVSISFSASVSPFPSPSLPFGTSSNPSSTSPSSSALPTSPYNAAEQMMLVLISYVIKEGGGSVTQTCVLKKVGPGIFSPPALARGFFALSQAMYNAWTRYHPWANATVPADDIPRILYGTATNGFSFSAPDAQEAVVRSAYIIIQYLLPERTALSNLAGQIANYYAIDVTNTPNMQNMASQVAWTLTNRLITNLNNDNSNQQGCYVDTGNCVAINNPTWLDSIQNATMASDQCRSPISWSQVVKPPYMAGPPPFLNPNAAIYTPFSINMNNIMPPPMPNMTIIHAMMMELPTVQSTLDSMNSYNKMITEYWIDGGGSPSPPGHWIYLAIKDVSQVKNYTLSQSIRLLFVVSASVYDAGIAVWNAKRFYSSVRPGTYVPTLMYKDLTTTLPNQYIGPYCKQQDIPAWNWVPYQPMGLNTPPFPEYPSGHSTFSGAASTALGNFTGTQNWPAGPKTITIEPGMSLFSYQCFRNGTNMYGSPCTFASCRFNSSLNSENAWIPRQPVVLGPFNTYIEAAAQAGLSRIMGGIHIWVSNVEGLTLGQRVTEQVFKVACQMMPCGESDQFVYASDSPSPAGTIRPTVVAASPCVDRGSASDSSRILNNSAVVGLLRWLGW